MENLQEAQNDQGYYMVCSTSEILTEGGYRSRVGETLETGYHEV